MASLRTQLVTVFLIVGILPLLFVGFFSICTVDSTLRYSVKSHLETTAQSRAQHIETWLEGHMSLVKGYSLNPVYQELLKNPNETLIQQKANEMLSNILRSHLDMISVCIINKTGSIIASSYEDLANNQNLQVLDLLRTQKVFVKDAYISDKLGIPCMEYGLPIHDPDSGELIGGVIATLNLDYLNNITTDRTGLGRTGEIYLVNKEGYMITNSRFKQDTFMKRKVDTDTFRECAEDIEQYGAEASEMDEREKSKGTDTRLYYDYRGIEVLGTDSLIPQMGWCLLAEIDAAEVLSPVKSAKFKISIMTMLSAVLILFVALLYSNRISQPLIHLQKTAEMISKGNLNTKISVNAEGEIGILAKSLDVMRKDVKKLKESLEQQVDKRTNELTKKVLELEKFKDVTVDTELYAEKMRIENESLKKEVKELKKNMKKAKRKYGK